MPAAGLVITQMAQPAFNSRADCIGDPEALSLI